MRINLVPQRREDALEVSRDGSRLVVNGETFDFSRMVSGDTLPFGAVDSHWFIGPVDNVAGELELTLLLPLPANYSQEQAFPVPLTNVPNGRVLLPQPLPEQVQNQGEQQ